MELPNHPHLSHTHFLLPSILPPKQGTQRIHPHLCKELQVNNTVLGMQAAERASGDTATGQLQAHKGLLPFLATFPKLTTLRVPQPRHFPPDASTREAARSSCTNRSLGGATSQKPKEKRLRRSPGPQPQARLALSASCTRISFVCGASEGPCRPASPARVPALHSRSGRRPHSACDLR